MTASAAPSSSRNESRPSPIIDGFALTGVSSLPDPATHAYRKDLADVALAGRVIASHYAEPLVRHLTAAAPLLPMPANDAEPIMQLGVGDEIRMLDNSRGWAWGYGPDGRVGYVAAEAVGI
ncbi:MAG TPA: hypothetical protein VGD23_04190 [Sphingomicrobium sp.]